MSALEDELYDLIRRAVRDELADQLAALAPPADAPAAAHTVSHTAQRLGISPRKVYELVTRGELRAIRFGRAVRIPGDAIDEYLRQRAS